MSDFKEYASKKFVEDHVKNALSSFSTVSSWNDLTDKPFDVEKIYCDWNEETEYSEYVTCDNSDFERFVKINNEPQTVDFIIGKQVYINAFSTHAGPIDMTQPMIEELITESSEDYYIIAGIIIVVIADSVNINGIVLSKGIWCADNWISEDMYFNAIKIFDPAITIDEAVIPDTIARVDQIKTDWNQTDETAIDYIKNRPFYMDFSNAIEFADLLGAEQKNIVAEDGLIGVRAFIPNATAMEIGKEYTVVVDGAIYTGIAEDCSDFGEGSTCFGDLDAMLNQDLNSFNYIILSQSSGSDCMFVIQYKGETEPNVCKLYEGAPSIVQLDEKYIPDTVARTSDVITISTTAKVGQTIVVKAVDENGKPTEWECVDIASGSGSGLPTVTEADNGKILTVVNGVWTAVALPNAEEASF